MFSWIDGNPVTVSDLISEKNNLAYQVGSLCGIIVLRAPQKNSASFLCKEGVIYDRCGLLLNKTIPFLTKTGWNCKHFINGINKVLHNVPNPTQFALVVHDLKLEHILIDENGKIAAILDFDTYFSDDPLMMISEFLSVIHGQLVNSKKIFILMDSVKKGYKKKTGLPISEIHLIFYMFFKGIQDIVDWVTIPSFSKTSINRRMFSCQILYDSLCRLIN
jgi:hypothetical protein